MLRLYSHSVIFFNSNNVPEFVNSITNAVHRYYSVISVYITGDPKICAIMSIYELRFKHITNYTIDHFSTVEAGKKWIAAK